MRTRAQSASLAVAFSMQVGGGLLCRSHMFPPWCPRQFAACACAGDGLREIEYFVRSLREVLYTGMSASGYIPCNMVSAAMHMLWGSGPRFFLVRVVLCGTPMPCSATLTLAAKTP